MKNRIKIYLLMIVIALTLFPISCDLEEQIIDEYTEDVIKSDPNLLTNLLAPPLAQLRSLWWRQSVWGLQEATSDELCFPTRGTDWGDNNVWVDNYNLTWKPDHRDVNDTWDRLNTGISAANTALLSLGLEQEGEAPALKTFRAQAIFLRAFYEYNLLDLYGVYPTRDPMSKDFSIPPTVYKGAAAFNRLVTIVKEIYPDMKLREYVKDSYPDYKEAQYGEPCMDAGLMLLAKLYLNKEVYTGVPGWDSSLIYLNQIIDRGEFNLATNYFSIFSYNNELNYKKADDEAIFVTVYDDRNDFGVDDQVVWVRPCFHYNQDFNGAAPSSWNGCMAPENYLKDVWVAGTDTAMDGRWHDSTLFNQMAINLGFNYGPQFDVNGDSIKDRGSKLLNYTWVCPLEGATENQGVRVLKYPPRPTLVDARRTTNDFIIWRYADALLMKTECLFRTGESGDALTLINEIRTKRNAPELATLELLDILGERGRELYWEGHRRQDMIRFGTFLLPKTNKETTSPATAKLLPIPKDAIDGSSGTITQNPGY